VLVVGAVAWASRGWYEVVEAAQSAVVLAGSVWAGVPSSAAGARALSSFLGSTPAHITQVIESIAPQLRELAPFLQKFLVSWLPAAAGPQLGVRRTGRVRRTEQVIRELAEQSDCVADRGCP
jgi:hypothetical protein